MAQKLVTVECEIVLLDDVGVRVQVLTFTDVTYEGGLTQISQYLEGLEDGGEVILEYETRIL
jgi:hypothetical protein